MTKTKSPARPGGPRLAGILLRTQPDDRLAELAGEGSKPAFDEMVRRHRGALVAFASRIAPPDRADDVVQDSMMKALLALRRGDRPESPKAWLFKIVRNTALNDQRDWKPYEHLDENYDGVEQPPEAAERRRQLKELVLALHELPEAQREAIVQRELEGKGHDEIASALEVSPGAVRQLIFRARGTLRAGVGALIPIQLLRLVSLAGADPATAGVAGAGLGFTAAKVGIGTVLATGAVVVGAQVGSDIKRQGDSKASAAELSQAEAAAPGEAAASEVAARGRNAAKPGNPDSKAARKKTELEVIPQRAPAPPPPLRQPRPPQGGGGAGGPTPPGGTGGGQGGGGPLPPPGSGQLGAPPPPGGTLPPLP